MIKTTNGDVAFEHSLDHSVEFFSKAGSLRAPKKGTNGSEETAVALFQKSWITDKELSFKLLLWLRDCRGGAGNRSGFRACLKWLASVEPEYVSLNISAIPAMGRWDDLIALYDTPCEELAIKTWAAAILEDNGLAAKWADRKDIKLISYFKKNVFTSIQKKEPHKYFRKLLAAKTNVVETKMCSKNWNEITYAHVPSLAMSRYSKAFVKNDLERFSSFKERVKTGEEKVHATTLFPHDCVVNALHGDKEMADAQFAALEDYLAGTDKKIMCICDTSGSMGVRLDGASVAQRVHVSMALSLYFSDRLGKENPFYRKFIQFCSESKLTDWSNMTFSQAVNNRHVFNQAVGSTNVKSALDSLLAYGKMFSVSPEHMPNMLLIASDMQFNGGTRDSDIPTVKECVSRWVEAGYNAPTVVYWNLAGFTGQPDTVLSENTILVSGFSPSVMESILKCESNSARDVMLKKLEKYIVISP